MATFSLDEFRKVVKKNMANGELAKSVSFATENPVEEPPKRKRGRPRKDQSKTATEGTDVVVDQHQENSSFPTDGSYNQSYDETNFLLRQTIGQINNLSNDVQQEINNIKASKTIKSKYKYLADLSSTAGTLLGTKISAIREMNSAISKCHDLELKRLKDLKDSQAQQDDDKYIADLYASYVNTPIGTGPTPIVRQLQANNTINDQAMMMGGIPTSEDSGYENYINNLTPEQNRMIMDGNPNIKTIVVYDQISGDKYFDVIDTTTNTSVPNYPRPDRLILDDTVIDFSNGIATNNNIGQNWEVMVVANEPGF